MPTISIVQSKIVDGEGEPMANVKMIAKQIQPIKGYEQFEAVTGSDGTFSFKKLFPTSDYILFPWFDDWSSAPQRTLKYEADKLTARFNKDGWVTEDKMKVQSGSEGQTIILKSPIAIMPTVLTPEFHGIYILDNEELTELGKKTSEEKRRNFNKNLSIVIFDRTIDKTVKKLEDIIALKNRSFVRCEIDNVYNRKKGNRIKTNIIQLHRYKLDGKIDFRLKPIKGEPEMIVIMPVKPLESGLYSIIFDEKSFPFAVGIGDILEADSPLNNCVDLYYSSIDKNALAKSFSWGNFIDFTNRSEGETTKGNIITESSYKPCNSLNKLIPKWKDDSREWIKQKKWLSVMEMMKDYLLIITPNDTDAVNLYKKAENAYIEESKTKAKELMKKKEWLSAIKLLKQCLIVIPNNTDITNLYKEAENAHVEKLRLEEEHKKAAIAAKIAKERPILISALSSRKSYFGEEVAKDSKTYPFRIYITSFNNPSHFDGEMDYYAKNDRAILKFNGKLIDNTLVIKHTGTIRKGSSEPLFTYSLNLTNNDKITGYYYKTGRTDKTEANVWINLNENKRIKQEKRYNLLEQSITPSKIIDTSKIKPSWGKEGTVTLTDVNYKTSYMQWSALQETEIFFYKIKSFKKSRSTYGYRITAITHEGRERGEIDFSQKEGESKRDDFYSKLTSTFEAWKTKYADILDVQ